MGCKGVSCIYLIQGCVCKVKADLYSFLVFPGPVVAQIHICHGEVSAHESLYRMLFGLLQTSH